MNKKVLIGILAVVVIVTGVVGYSMMNKDVIKDPVKHIMAGAWNTNTQSNINADIAVKVQLDEKIAVEQNIFEQYTSDSAAMAKYANTLLDKLALMYKVNVISNDNEDLFKMDAGIGLYYNKKAILDGTFYAKPWEIGFVMPKLTEKTLSFDLEQVLQDEGIDFPIKDINLKEYLDVLSKKDDLYNEVAKNSETYSDVIYNYLQGKVEKLDNDTITVDVYGKEKNVKVTKYKVNVEILDIYDVYAKLIEVAKDDEAVKALVKARINDLEKLVLENKDYEKFDITESQFKEGMKGIENSIDTEWDKALEELLKELKEISMLPKNNEELEKMSSDIIVSIDNDNMMRQVEVDMQVEMVKIKEIFTINAFGEDVKVDIKDDPNNKINIMDLENNESLTQELTNEVIKNLGEILGGEAIEEIVNDIKEESKILPKEESDTIINSVDMYFAQMKLMLPFMLQGMGM